MLLWSAIGVGVAVDGAGVAMRVGVLVVVGTKLGQLMRSVRLSTCAPPIEFAQVTISAPPGGSTTVVSVDWANNATVPKKASGTPIAMMVIIAAIKCAGILRFNVCLHEFHLLDFHERVPSFIYANDTVTPSIERNLNLTTHPQFFVYSLHLVMHNRAYTNAADGCNLSIVESARHELYYLCLCFG